MKEKIKNSIKNVMEELSSISKYIYENPEEGHKEFKASSILEDFLQKQGFEVEKAVYGIETAFKATYDSKKEGAKIAYLCEYDALPEIGHGCGHNLISSMSIGAGIGLKSVIDDIGGSIAIFGTPAEETSGAKVKMVEEGAFKDVTAAMMVHPGPVTEKSGTSLALQAVQFEFHGKSAHAAKYPEKGVNALDGTILTFNNINALRQHIPSDVRIHGIINHGGKAPNIVPDYASAQFYIRAKNKQILEDVSNKVKHCAEAAAMATGSNVKISNFELSYDNMVTNYTLSEAFINNLKDLGEKDILDKSDAHGSLDMGNVSNVVPAIHTWVGVGNKNLVLHTKEFADFTQSDSAKEAVYKGACALALTGYDIIISKELREKIQQEFKENILNKNK
ncbi:p-aminobenzoyl-glutamate hydrolase subunit B [Clostridium acetireducens DSM 10703]|uniref:Peptidase M20 domain-containing protein 2 n=1 Tax=Clostridium acetireducens DSM 10703 TaxID=1121290 RepID=A0A1E8EZ67_9CLOT|nr:M20 family metallopeptidase [Clostridium acetireducens]OFI06289.1 p-aminobenzoyl-glutamate hydrolase subunit B [Clostridium acetireducens DSM 10703]